MLLLIEYSMRGCAAESVQEVPVQSMQSFEGVEEEGRRRTLVALLQDSRDIGLAGISAIAVTIEGCARSANPFYALADSMTL